MTKTQPNDAVLEAKLRADAELKELRSSEGPSFLERHGVPTATATETCENCHVTLPVVPGLSAASRVAPHRRNYVSHVCAGSDCTFHQSIAFITHWARASFYARHVWDDDSLWDLGDT